MSKEKRKKNTNKKRSLIQASEVVRILCIACTNTFNKFTFSPKISCFCQILFFLSFFSNFCFSFFCYKWKTMNKKEIKYDFYFNFLFSFISIFIYLNIFCSCRLIFVLIDLLFKTNLFLFHLSLFIQKLIYFLEFF